MRKHLWNSGDSFVVLWCFFYFRPLSFVHLQFMEIRTAVLSPTPTILPTFFFFCIEKLFRIFITSKYRFSQRMIEFVSGHWVQLQPRNDGEWQCTTIRRPVCENMQLEHTYKSELDQKWLQLQFTKTQNFHNYSTSKCRHAYVYSREWENMKAKRWFDCNWQKVKLIFLPSGSSNILAGCWLMRACPIALRYTIHSDNVDNKFSGMAS